ncbi:MAG: SHOCT domain-containing protein [Bacilli bacterium]|nr:SHOCT domain-containing protein [Bacilli bacterium]
MEEKVIQPVIHGKFAFDEKGFFYLGAGFFALVATAFAIVFHFVTFEMSWLIIAICAGIAFLCGIVGWVGKLRNKKKSFVVYEDRVEYSGDGTNFTMEIATIKILKVHESMVTMLSDEAGHTVDGLTNADDLGATLRRLMAPAPVPEAPKDGPVVYSNLAVEELRAAKQLLDQGLITEDDYNEKKREYLDSFAEVFVDNAGGSQIPQP